MNKLHNVKSELSYRLQFCLKDVYKLSSSLSCWELEIHLSFFLYTTPCSVITNSKQFLLAQYRYPSVSAINLSPKRIGLIKIALSETQNKKVKMCSLLNVKWVLPFSVLYPAINFFSLLIYTFSLAFSSNKNRFHQH